MQWWWWKMLLLSLVWAGAVGDTSIGLEARFLAKHAALEEKMADAKAAKELEAVEARFLAKHAALEEKMAEAEAEAKAARELEAAKTLFPVQDETGKFWGNFSIGRVDTAVHPADAFLNWALEKGLPSALRLRMSDALCARVGPTECFGGRTRAIVATLPVSTTPTLVVGTIVLLDGQEAADAAFNFTATYNRNMRSRGAGEGGGGGLLPVPQATNQLRNALCASWPGVVECSREKALVYHRPAGWVPGSQVWGARNPFWKLTAEAAPFLPSSGTPSEPPSSADGHRTKVNLPPPPPPPLPLPGALWVYEGEEVADLVHALLVKAHGFKLEDYRAVVDAICAETLSDSDTAVATVAAETAADEEEGEIGNNGSVADLRASSGNLSSSGSESLEREEEEEEAWPHLVCGRRRVVEQTVPVADSNADPSHATGQQQGERLLGTVLVLDGEEPVDAVFAFARTVGLVDVEARRTLLEHVCRQRLEQAELNHLKPCQRDQAVLVQGLVWPQNPPHFNGGAAPLGPSAAAVALPLVIWEHEEPADVALRWCEAAGVSGAKVKTFSSDNDFEDLDFVDALIAAICDGAFSRGGGGGLRFGLPVRCQRRQALQLSLPLSDEAGKPLGLFTLLRGEEPADACFAFSKRNNVAPGFRAALLATLCGPNNAYGLQCARTRALAVVKRAVSAHFGYQGPWHPTAKGCYQHELSVWEDEEPADAVRRFSLTVPLPPGADTSLPQPRVGDGGGSGGGGGGGGWSGGPKSGMPLAHRQGIVFGLCGDADLGLACTRPTPAQFVMKVDDEAGPAGSGSKGQLVVLEGQRPADALLQYMKENKLAQVFKHPNLRRRLFHRLCAAAKESSSSSSSSSVNAEDDEGLLDCSVEVPRILAVSVEMTYQGLKAFVSYFFPDHHYDPQFPDAPSAQVTMPRRLQAAREGDLYPPSSDSNTTSSSSSSSSPLASSSFLLPTCVALPPGLEPLSDEEEAQVARFGYDQSLVDPLRRVWLAPQPSFTAAKATKVLPADFSPGTEAAAAAAAAAAARAELNAQGVFESEPEGPSVSPLRQGEVPLPTEALTGCLSPTRRASLFFCERLSPPPNHCVRDIHAALLQHLTRDDESRWVKAGPVGIDYYQMMRCPHDAPLAEVKQRMDATSSEVALLAKNVTARVLFTRDAWRLGAAALSEGAASLQGASAAVGGARQLLEAASKSLSAAKQTLEATQLLGEASNAALGAASLVAEALRERLLSACNETLVARNCSLASVFVRLGRLTKEERRQALLSEALAGEEAFEAAAEVAAQKSGLKADARAAVKATASSATAVAAKGQQQGQGKQANKFRAAVNFEELTRRREELIAARRGVTGGAKPQQPQQQQQDSSMVLSTSSSSSNKIVESTTAVVTGWGGSAAVVDHVVELRLLERNRRVGRRLAVLLTEAGFPHEVVVDADDEYAAETVKAAGGGEEQEEGLGNRNRNVVMSVGTTATGDEDGISGGLGPGGGGGGGRLVERRVWRVCLERDAWAAANNGTLDLAAARMPSDLLLPGVNASLSAVSKGMEAPLTSRSVSAAALPVGSSGGATAADALQRHTRAYSAAVEGCARLAVNASWVCPSVAGRLAGILPRFPVDAALAAAREVLASFAANLAAVKTGLKAGRASFTAAKTFTDASRSGRALGAAALYQANLRLREANVTAAGLKERDLEAAKHRAWTLERAAFDLTEGKNREFYDKPCRPVFGACCARDAADGGMSITCG